MNSLANVGRAHAVLVNEGFVEGGVLIRLNSSVCILVLRDAPELVSGERGDVTEHVLDRAQRPEGIVAVLSHRPDGVSDSYWCASEVREPHVLVLPCIDGPQDHPLAREQFILGRCVARRGLMKLNGGLI